MSPALINISNVASYGDVIHQRCQQVYIYIYIYNYDYKAVTDCVL